MKKKTVVKIVAVVAAALCGVAAADIAGIDQFDGLLEAVASILRSML